MRRNALGKIITNEPVTDSVKAFYVSIISPDGKQSRLALGPFDTKAQAEARVDDVIRHVADQNYRDHHWFSYGTCGYTGDGTPPEGCFNGALMVHA